MVLEAGSVAEDRGEHSVQRRRFIKRLIVGIPILAAASSLLAYLLASKPREESKSTTESLEQLISYEVTPTNLFYAVSLDVVSPNLDASRWRLKVHGLVEEPMQFTLGDIKSMRSVGEYATLECVSNPVGGDLISNAYWRGVQLKTLLELVKVKPNARYIVFRCFEGYSVGIPIEAALDEGTILAYEMNYEPLTLEHGYPLRLIVPKYYGMMNPKWIVEIEVVDYTYLGFWQKLGWANEAEYQTHSTILVPGYSPLRRRFNLSQTPQQAKLGERLQICGVAFAGERGISKVEVSLDDGVTWMRAKIRKPLSKYSWVLWWLDWVPEKVGVYRLMVRAVDGNGVQQIGDLTEPYPEGATGYHTIVFRVE